MMWFKKKKRRTVGALKVFCPYYGGVNPIIRSFGQSFKVYNGANLALVTDGNGAYIKVFDGTVPWPDYDNQTQIHFCPICGRNLYGDPTCQI